MTLGAQSPRQRNGDTGLSDGILPETPICESENMQIVLKKMAEGFSIESGYQRLQAAFETSDELLVDSPSLGKVLLMKLPDGQLVATQNKDAITIFSTTGTKPVAGQLTWKPC